MPPSCCFDGWARAGLRRARRGKLDGITSALLDAVASVGLSGRSLLDVGCGAGALVVGSIERGADRATGTDLGAGAIEAARTLASERGVRGRSTFVSADGSVAELGTHDVVTLNRVICCYPDPVALVEHTLGAAAQVYAFTLPRSTGPVGRLNRAFVRMGNVFFRLRRGTFGDYRAFVHDGDAIHRRVVSAGFERVSVRRVYLVWHLALYVRAPRAS